MLFFDILGNVGMVLITFSLIPQIIKTGKEKEVKNISPVFLLSQWVAGICMIPYGVYLKSIPVIVINSGMLINSSLLIYLFVKYGDTCLNPQGTQADGATQNI